MASKAGRWSKQLEVISHEGEKKVFEKDTRFWTPTRDDKGNALAIIRFIPDIDDTGYIKYTCHSFQYQHGDSTKWYIENCLNTFGFEQGCPICKKVQEYYNSPHTSDKELGSERRAKKYYVANILILKNPNKPDEEGQVKLFKFGQKIFDKIKSRMFPSDTDKADPDFKTFVPFDEYEGANFKLKVKGLKRDTNYDDSLFADPSTLFEGNETKIKELISKTSKLSEFLSPEKYPTNESVIDKVGHLFGIQKTTQQTVATPKNIFEEDDIPAFASDDDDDDAFFSNLKK